VVNQTDASPISTEKSISEIAGRVDLADGASALAYRALRSLICSACGMVIAEGALFTRHKVNGIGVNIMPRCLRCEPFTLRASKEEKSALLKSLLAGPPASPPKDSVQAADNSSQNSSKPQGEEKNPVEEMRKRLGPALKRGRRR
jgi:hypothetical protein